MYTSEVREALRNLVGEWSTVENDITNMVIDAMDELEELDGGYAIEVNGWDIDVVFEDIKERPSTVTVRYEKVGSTYVISEIF